MQNRYFLYTALLSGLALIIALISQHGFSLRPCAWCVFQRLILVVLIVVAVIGYLLSLYNKTKTGVLIARVLIVFTAAGGALAAWYQYSVASTVFSCDMSLADQVMTQSGLEAALPWLFGIYATCMDASVNVLGLEYALWALILFLFIALANVFVLFKK